ncbi:MAG: SH3 domain-containing protein [Deltaproteobacteria bacterium]|nr:MAG: SH3 domain-containing protein [Deltaproteobacteria bacterium]
MKSVRQGWPLGIRGLTGVVSCLIGFGVVYFGFGIGPESPKKEASAEANPVARRDLGKPVRAMNFALGNMVYFARELGFSAKAAKDSPVDTNKIAARIENQLQGMREIYQLEVAKNPTLVGTMMLQFNIAPTGEVSQVKEASARINDDEFKKRMLAEASKWSFAEIVSENLTVTCPLLFVHEGMDITTLVRWEKSISDLNDKPTPARLVGDAAPTQQANAPSPVPTIASAKQAPAVAPKANLATPGKSEGKEFRIKYATVLRKDPNFASPSLTTYTIGTKVTVLQRQGDWLEVRSNDNGPIGFIRKEFAEPLEVAHN